MSYLEYINGKEKPEIEILRCTDGTDSLYLRKTALKQAHQHPLVIMNSNKSSIRSSDKGNSPR